MAMNAILVAALCAVSVHYSNAGALYTRWGRTTCAEDSRVIYSGFMAGNHYQNTGGGANYLCVQNSPEKGSGNVAGFQAASGNLYPVQYWFDDGYLADSRPFSLDNNGGKVLYTAGAVCVLCYNEGASSQVMIPGKQSCPDSAMNLEYSGYLASDYSGHMRTEFICMDGAPEPRQAGQADSAQSIIYAVQGACPAGQACQFVDGDEVTCAVCTI